MGELPAAQTTKFKVNARLPEVGSVSLAQECVYGLVLGPDILCLLVFCC